MAIDLPPPLIIPKPAIIQPGEPWEHQFSRDLARHGIPFAVCRDIIAEVKRLGSLTRPALDDISRYAGLDLAMMPAAAGIIAGNLKDIVVTYTGTSLKSSGSNVKVFTFTAVATGPADPDRTVFVLIALMAPQTVDSVTIDGVAAQIVVAGDPSNTSAGACCAIAMAKIPDGTASTVVVTATADGDAGGVRGCGILTLCATGVAGRVIGAKGVGPQSGGTVETTTINKRKGALTLGVAFSQASTGTVTWAGLTKFFDGAYDDGGTNRKTSMASELAAANSDDVTVSATFSASHANRAMAVATVR